MMNDRLENVISIWDEMVAYETLWALPNQSLKTIAGLFAAHSGKLPTDILGEHSKEQLLGIEDTLSKVEAFLKGINDFSVCVNRTFHYPKRLRDARYPIELFYYKGDIGHLESPRVSIVGARKCTEEGVKRARKLAIGLVERGFTIVSGLAAGIDTAAMRAAIENDGYVIGVIGTPINKHYPPENKEFQEQIGKGKLLISQVPFYRYSHEPFTSRRRYFPQRNETMAALSEATIIVEASDTSGTLTQARACLRQGRKLFILNSCFENPDINWPQTYAERGALRVRDFDDIFEVLKSSGGGV